MSKLSTNEEYNRFTANNDEPIKDRLKRKPDASVKGIGYIIFLVIVFITSYYLFAKYYFV